jgi:hypothetical protein
MAAIGLYRLLLAPLLRMSIKTQMNLETLIVLLASVGLIYSWYFYFSRIRREVAGWRNRVTVLSLTLVSICVLLLPVILVLMPRVVGVPQKFQFLESWRTPIVRILLAAFLLCFFGRPRLIGPVAVACLGTALIWLSIMY